MGASLACVFLTLALGIWVGPTAAYISIGVGFLLAGAALVVNSNRILCVFLIGSHLLLFFGVLASDMLFLRPLADRSLQMPRLTEMYRDPKGFFEMRVPQGWIVEEVHTATEMGIRLRPADRQQYMGVSELTVRVRELLHPESNPVTFLKRLAQSMEAKPKTGRLLFEFSTRPAQLLDGGKGMWSHLVIKRFWVPLYQLALYGIKQKRYLCTVSASGIKNHDTLSEVLCLGIFHTLRFPADSGKH